MLLARLSKSVSRAIVADDPSTDDTADCVEGASPGILFCLPTPLVADFGNRCIEN